eukprot:2184560-Pyramimonas_sp.AAC.1
MLRNFDAAGVPACSRFDRTETCGRRVCRGLCRDRDWFERTGVFSSPSLRLASSVRAYSPLAPCDLRWSPGVRVGHERRVGEDGRVPGVRQRGLVRHRGTLHAGGGLGYPGAPVLAAAPLPSGRRALRTVTARWRMSWRVRSRPGVPWPLRRRPPRRVVPAPNPTGRKRPCARDPQRTGKGPQCAEYSAGKKQVRKSE